jgi:putative transposase
MIDRGHDLSVAKQAKALGISRSSVYYLPRPVSVADLTVMRRMDELHLEFPFAGSRMLRDMLGKEGIEIGRRHIATLMKRMGVLPESSNTDSRRSKIFWAMNKTFRPAISGQGCGIERGRQLNKHSTKSGQLQS